jgi:ABC-2 type transport system permease protein
MKTATHLRYEILRILRNRMFVALAVGLPVVLFYAVASANFHGRVNGISFPLFFMAAMAAYGSMYAVVTPGVRIALDRARGWTRQQRITPLRLRTDVMARAGAAYVVALPTLIVVFVAGSTLGVRLTAGQWLEMTGLILVGLLPLAVMGIALGYLIRADTAPLAIAGPVVLMALLGGEFGPLFTGGLALTLAKMLPSYWLAQAVSVAVSAGDWPIEGWLVVAAWTLAMIGLAVLSYRQTAARV